MREWQTVIRDGKASTKAIYRGTQYISEWGNKGAPGTRYLLVCDNADIGFFDTADEAKAAADRIREVA